MVISGRVCLSGQLALTTAGQAKIRAAMPAVAATSGVDGRNLAGHGSASSSICLPACSSGARNVRVGSGGVYTVSCPATAW